MNLTVSLADIGSWISIIVGCGTIVVAIIKHTASFAEMTKGVKLQLQSLTNALNEIKDILHGEVVPKLNSHAERLAALDEWKRGHDVSRDI